MRYSIDSSTLIHLRHFIQEVHVNMWKNINEMIESKNIFATKEVLLELKKDNKKCRKYWENVHIKNGKDFFKDPTKNETRIAKRIINKYDGFVRPKHYSETGLWADPFVIALAKEKDAIVISEESSKKGDNIQYVCYDLGIKCMNLNEFMRYNKWRF